MDLFEVKEIVEWTLAFGSWMHGNFDSVTTKLIITLKIKGEFLQLFSVFLRTFLHRYCVPIYSCLPSADLSIIVCKKVFRNSGYFPLNLKLLYATGPRLGYNKRAKLSAYCLHKPQLHRLSALWVVCPTTGCKRIFRALVQHSYRAMVL